jgi:glycerol uptake facilitator-like aquaporin
MSELRPISPRKDVATTVPRALSPAHGARMIQPGVAELRLSLGRRAAIEALGTGLLVAAVVGSGIMGERLAGGNLGLALLANTAATGAALVALILALGPLSGAHFNPIVTLADSVAGDLPWSDVPAYLTAQVTGGLLGTAVANVMFENPVFSLSRHGRAGAAQLLSEVVATFGLLLIIGTCARRRPNAIAFGVAAYITAAYWFTASTSFANPAVTLARAVSDTFAGIRPGDVPGFVGAQIVGGALAILLMRWLLPRAPMTDPERP